MRMPRIRFTIGRLMVAVLAAAIVMWAVSAIWLTGTPTIPELQAEASYKQAKLVREVAEYAVKEYEQGIYLQERATYKGQIALAKADQQRALDRLRWSSEMDKSPQSHIIKPFLEADQRTKQQADFDLEQAKTQLEVLEKYTKEKQIKSLRSDVENARADEQAKFKMYLMERAKRLQIFKF